MPELQLTRADRYNPTNLSFMEDYLMSQVREGTYDLLANLAVLKL
jgi:translation initiation factor 3 subunit K